MQLSIVYLDDEIDLCEMFKDIFSSDTIQIKTFIDPEAAIAEIERELPDLVFLDYRLPSTNGESVARRLDPSIPKVLVTGDLEVNPSNLFLKVFGKPYDSKEVQNFIDGILLEKRRRTKTT